MINKNWRYRLFEVIEIAEDGDKLSNIYDISKAFKRIKRIMISTNNGMSHMLF